MTRFTDGKLHRREYRTVKFFFFLEKYNLFAPIILPVNYSQHRIQHALMSSSSTRPLLSVTMDVDALTPLMSPSSCLFKSDTLIICPCFIISARSFFGILHVAVYLGFASSPKKLVLVLLIPHSSSTRTQTTKPKVVEMS